MVLQFNNVELTNIRVNQVGTVSYEPEAVEFDGTNDTTSRGGALTGITNGKVGAFASWFKMSTGSDGRLRPFYIGGGGNGSNTFGVSISDSGNQLEQHVQVWGEEPGGALTIKLTNNTFVSNSSGWFHIMMSWDLATATAHVYLNGVEDKAASPTLNNNNIQYVGTNAFFARTFSATTFLYNGDVTDFWFTNEYLNLADSDVRDKLYLAGKPVDLGTTGQGPTGTSAIVYLRGNAATWNAGNANVGTGGPFAMAGSVTDSVNEPVEV